MNVVYNIDCMEYMENLPDKEFDLAVVDPPYAINRFKNGKTSRLRKYGSLKTVNNLRPTKEWFQELVRVSKNQIVLGTTIFATFCLQHQNLFFGTNINL